MKKIKKIAALALAGVMVMSGFVACGKNPKETVMDSFSTLASGASAKGFIDELGVATVLEGLEKKPYTVGMKFTLEDSSFRELSMFESASIYTEVACDSDAKKALLDLGVGYGNSDLISGQFYIDEKQMAVALPDVLDEVLYVEYDNIVKKLKKSALVKEFELNEDDMAELEEAFKTIEDAMKKADDNKVAEFILGFEKDIENFKDKIGVKEIESEEFEINGKDQKCEGYELTITVDTIVDLVESAMEYYLLSDDAKEFFESIEEQVGLPSGDNDVAMDSYYDSDYYYDVEKASTMDELYDFIDEVKENKRDILKSVKEYLSDIEIEMYIYEGEIVSLEAEMKIPSQDASMGNLKIKIELECTGGDYSVYDNYKLSLKAMGMTMLTLEKVTDNSSKEYGVSWSVSGTAIEGSTIGCSFTMDKKDGDFEAKATVNAGSTKINLDAEGTIEIEKKKSVKVEFDDITFAYEDYWDDFSISVSGEYYVECDTDVSMPKGDKINVLTDDKEELEDLLGIVEDLQEEIEEIMWDFY